MINITFQTIASEIRNHKWELQDLTAMPVMDEMANLMDDALAANRSGDRQRVHSNVAAYRTLHAANVNRLK